MSGEAELNALIDEYAVSTVFSRDTLTYLAREYPHVEFVKWVVEMWTKGYRFPADSLWEMWAIAASGESSH